MEFLGYFVAAVFMCGAVIGLTRDLRIAERKKRILEEGPLRQATVLSIDQSWSGESGVTVELSLEVHGGEVVSVRAEVEPHLLPQLREGMHIPVRVDPDDPSTALIDEIGFCSRLDSL